MIDKIFTAFCLVTLAIELQSCQETAARSLNSPCPSPRVAKPAGFLENGCPKDLSQELLLPHDRSCKKYYICSYGQKLTMECPPGLHFSPAMKVCDWPARSGCQDPVPQPDARSLQLMSPDQRCSQDWSVLTMFPDREDCGKFYMCANGVAMAMACDPGMHFNAELMICDWPNSARCSARTAASIRNSKSQNLSATKAEAIAPSNPEVATLIEPSPTIISIKTTYADTTTSENAETKVAPIICISIQPESVNQGDAKAAKLIAQKTKTGKEINIIKTCPEPNTGTNPVVARSQKIEVPSTASELEEVTPTQSFTDIVTTVSDKELFTQSISTPTTANIEIISTLTSANTEIITQATAQISNTETTTVTIQEESTTATTETDFKKSYKDLDTSTVQSTETTTESISTLVTLSLNSDETATTTVTEATSISSQSTDETTMESTFSSFASLDTETTQALTSGTYLQNTESATDTSTTAASTETDIPLSPAAHKVGKSVSFPQEITTEVTIATENSQSTETSTQTEDLTSTSNTESTTTEEAATETTSSVTETLSASTTSNTESTTTEEAATETASSVTEALSASTTLLPNTESSSTENGIISTVTDTTITESLLPRSGKELISTTDNNEQSGTTIGEGIYSTTAETVENTTLTNGNESTTMSICDDCTLSAKYWAEKTNCSGYWECEGGKQVLKFCPPGLRFNRDLETCDFEKNVKCN